MVTSKSKYYILEFSVLLYILALFNTLYTFEPQIDTGIHSRCTSDVSCLKFFIGEIIQTPYDVLFLLNEKINSTLLWCSNISYLYILSLWIKQRKMKTLFILVALSIALIITFYFCHEQIIGEMKFLPIILAIRAQDIICG